jgi:hypothetical protein
MLSPNWPDNSNACAEILFDGSQKSGIVVVETTAPGNIHLMQINTQS